MLGFLDIFKKSLSSLRKMVVKAGLIASLDHSVEGNMNDMYLCKPLQAIDSGSYGDTLSNE